MNGLLVATRSSHKMAEIREMLGPASSVRILDLNDVGLPPTPDEDEIEAFDTFEANALAKARHFFALSGVPTMADDSGLCVDALGGAPGVWSKRFSGRDDLTGLDLDLANNSRLLEALDGVPPSQRTAHYVCVMAVVGAPSGEQTFRGKVDGKILEAPRGDGGFGYDPLFFVPELDATFAQVPAAEKNRISHRSRALVAARAAILAP